MSMAVELKTDAVFGGYNEDEGKFSLFYYTLQHDSFSIIAVMGKKLCER